FALHQGDVVSWAENREPGSQVPSGWRITAAKFEVEWPSDLERTKRIRSHFGARRKAYNWALARVKSDMDARKINPDHESVPWNSAAFRKCWNREKHEVAPWWAENSKECYSSGFADLEQGLKNWKAGKNSTRKGKKPQFPVFRSARNDLGRVRFTTDTMRLEPDRRTITLPVIGGLRSKENTRRVQRHLASGRARILNMTLSERWGRLFVSVCYAVRTPDTPVGPVQPELRAGVDLGLRVLATVSSIGPDGKEIIQEFENPAPLRASLAARGRAGRQMSRRIPGSRGHREAKAKLRKMDRRCVYLRAQTSHQLTTELARVYGQIVVEDLDIAGMKKSMGKKAFRRLVSDAALGRVRPQLTYKTQAGGSTLIVADRWYPSSQLHHGHVLPDGTPCRLEGKTLIDKVLRCPSTGELVDRDVNAARNLRDWPGYASRGLVKASVPYVSSPVGSGGDGGPDGPRERAPGERV
ncbi:MAG: IS607 family element RNA-guided endonuclease TnpB, partial [Streptosporangiales bacterium]|nr:IS607 family element RNA-guided endonuclease TnpB [Streptosporangiales bacterium]